MRAPLLLALAAGEAVSMNDLLSKTGAAAEAASRAEAARQRAHVDVAAALSAHSGDAEADQRLKQKLQAFSSSMAEMFAKLESMGSAADQHAEKAEHDTDVASASSFLESLRKEFHDFGGYDFTSNSPSSLHQVEDYNTELNDMVAASALRDADVSASPMAMTAAGEDWGLSQGATAAVDEAANRADPSATDEEVDRLAQHFRERAADAKRHAMKLERQYPTS